jgi:hypothetical protein
VIAPLNLVHVDLPSTVEMDILFQNVGRSLAVGQVVVEINGILINFLEGLGLVRGLETLAKLGDVENVMKFRQLRR